MNLKKYIYFSWLGYSISLMLNFLAFFHRPFMVYGYRNRVNKKWMRNIRISSSVVILNKEKLNISDNVWVWHQTIIDASNKITIGEGCQIGAWVGIFTHSSHISLRLHGQDYINFDSDNRLGYVRAPVEIGEYTFVGAGAIILPGVKIGKGSLVAAGSVVNKSFPDFAIVSGNPARVIGNTRDLDEKYFDEIYVGENYFDKGVLKDYLMHNI
jgi:acetyltransferase-like isoleucine patch superfamily enzyme